MHIFYAPDIINGVLTLSKEESQHAVKVLRLQAGDTIRLIDGQGGFYEAQITLPDAKNCGFKITNTTTDYNKRNFHLHIAVAPTKNIDRFEWFLEKATEIGIDEITPILCEHSERKIIKPERLDKVIVSAMKQSIRAYHPRLNALTDLNSFLNISNLAAYEQKYIAHCEEDQKESLKQAYQNGKKTLILIGPEGDFSGSEIESAIQAGFKPISLGKHRLRTETAAVVACHTVNLLEEL